MGDPAIEELFVLVADAGIDNTACVIAPSDPRQAGWDTPPPDAPPWTGDLYAQIARRLETLQPGLQSTHTDGPR